MPKYYSHSKIGSFEQCPLRFKYRYIDKIYPEFNTIEAHLGSVVHATLEWLYTQVQKNIVPTIDEVIDSYTKKWTEDYTENVIIVKQDLTVEDYFSKGVEFLLEYYFKNKPFDDNTLELEKKIIIKLDEEGEYIITGYIDRISHNLELDEYEIHDYKTANSMPTKEQVENDRQLALYSIALKELFGDEVKICLTWHYLAHNQKICSRRTNEQLEKLKQEIIEKIKKIESTKEFNYSVSKLCDWCEYKSMCLAWKK